MEIIATDNLCKSYGVNRVLQNVDLTIQSGKLVGFLGPNGAGKTTTIRILLGLLLQDSGQATLLGQSCWSHGKSLRKEVGYLPGDVHLYPNMSGKSVLKHFARVRKKNCDAEIARLSDRFQLPLNRSVRKYSTGMRQKLGLIQALMHQPKLLVLDEPTSALDPLIRTQVFEELKDVIRQGRSVLFSSHSLDEVDELCDEVVILRSGKIVEHQKIDVLRKRALRKVEVHFSGAVKPAEIPNSFQVLTRNSNMISGTWSGPIDELLVWIQPLSIDDLFIERPDLNDLFITYYSEPDMASDSSPSEDVGGKGGHV